MTHQNRLKQFHGAALECSMVALIIGLAMPASAEAQTTDQSSPVQGEQLANGLATNEASDGLADIVVTGSRIRRTGYDTLQPTTVLSNVTIENRAVNSVADVMREQPSFGTPGSSPVGDQGRVSVGQSFVNFFGLGSQRTLTLVNGARFPSASTPSASGSSPGLQVDLNTIPVALIDRVETIAVGGAPIYGSDAIAGTVNVILKKKFVGFDASASNGISDRGDANKYRLQATYGLDFADGRGNIVLNADYNHQSSLLYSDRALTAEQSTFQPPEDPNSPYNFVVVRNSRYPFVAVSGIPLRFYDYAYYGGEARDAAGDMVQFSPTGDLVRYDPGTPSGDVNSGGDGINLAPFSTLLAKSDRYLGNIFVNYEFQPSLRLHLEGWYSRTDAVEPANQPLYNSYFFRGDNETDARFETGPIPIRLTNPYLTSQARAILSGSNATDIDGDGVADPILDLDGDGVPDTQGFYLDRVNLDLTGRKEGYVKQELYRFLGTLEGDFNIGDRRFGWSLTGAYGATSSGYRQRAILVDRLNQAVDAITSPGGQIVCRDASDGCVPINLFTGSPDPASVAFVTTDIRSRTKTSQTLISANMNGDLFELPAGNVGIAVGADYRREHSSFQPDALSQTGTVRGVPATPVAGGFNTKEVYGETLVPIVSPTMDIPFISKLELEGAIRYVDHSLAGGDITWTAGGRYAPLQGFEFRGNFTRSIRSPAVTELFLPDAPILAFASDPCDRAFIGSGNNPARRAANCAAAGIPAGFNSDIVRGSRLISVSGNQNLANEQANAWTVGAIVSPRFLPGFVASVDWVDIRLKNAIVQLNATNVLSACYDSADYPNAPVCSNFERDAEGQIANLRTGFVNAGSVQFAGLTANLTYGFGIGKLGNLTLGANYQYTDKLTTSVTGSDFDEDAGEIGNSKHRGAANINWEKDGFNLFWQAIFIGKARFDNSDAPGSREVSGVGNWTVFNAAASYEVQKNLQLRLSVDNVFDRSAPRNSVVDDIGVVTYYSGLIGRTYTLTARMRF